MPQGDFFPFFKDVASSPTMLQIVYPALGAYGIGAGVGAVKAAHLTTGKILERGIIAYGASLETETTFATVGKEGVPEINMMSTQDFISIPLGQNVSNNLEFGKKLKKAPFVFGVNYFLRDKDNGKFLNAPQDKHVWIKWMELRVHGEAGAIRSPTGFLPKYEDLRKLFNRVLNKDYSKEDYINQFTIRVPENLAKIERVQRFYQENVTDTPAELFEILDQQRKRLVEAKERFGDYISPESFEW